MSEQWEGHMSQSDRCNPQHTLLPRSSLLQEALPDCLDPLGFCRQLLGG